MNKKDLGLLVLIVVVALGVYLRNPLFLSPNNIANTANLIGLFGIFAIAQGFVIITGGIELSAGSMIALLGVLFVDMVGRLGVPWPIAAMLSIGLGLLLGLAHGLLISRLKMQPLQQIGLSRSSPSASHRSSVSMRFAISRSWHLSTADLRESLASTTAFRKSSTRLQTINQNGVCLARCFGWVTR